MKRDKPLISRLKRTIPVCLALVLVFSPLLGKTTGISMAFAGFLLYLYGVGGLEPERKRREIQDRQARREMPLLALDAGRLDFSQRQPATRCFLYGNRRCFHMIFHCQSGLKGKKEKNFSM